MDFSQVKCRIFKTAHKVKNWASFMLIFFPTLGRPDTLLSGLQSQVFRVLISPWKQFFQQPFLSRRNLGFWVEISSLLCAKSSRPARVVFPFSFHLGSTLFWYIISPLKSLLNYEFFCMHFNQIWAPIFLLMFSLIRLGIELLIGVVGRPIDVRNI